MFKLRRLTKNIVFIDRKNLRFSKNMLEKNVLSMETPIRVNNGYKIQNLGKTNFCESYEVPWLLLS